jgi:hypothetical protein
MRVRRILALLPLLILAVAAGCGKEAGGPTGPSPGRSFLEGTWSGTLTIERPGEPSSTGQVSWTFQTVDGTNLQSFRVTIRSQHAWLPITTTVTSAITPSNQPPARISTQGEYQSPRGCTGTLLSVGNAETRTIDADFSGVDCSSLANSTFTGRVTLSKTG